MASDETSAGQQQSEPASANSDAEPCAEAWEVDTLRFTAFLPGELDAEHSERWWRDVAKQKTREEVSMSQGGLVEQGIVDGKVLRLQCQGARIDWFLQPKKAEPGEEQPDIYSLGKLGPSLATFVRYMKVWFELPTCPVAKRIALGGILLHRVADREEGYRFLQPLLRGSVQLDVENSREFNYTINRRRPSPSVEGLEMNRMTKWFVWTWKPFAMTIRLQPGPVLQQTEEGAPKMACRLELDINTAPEFAGTFDQRAQEAILNELTAFAEEIAAKGDVK
ncbi:MAG: hypothetical protein ACYTKD_20665 [Planctomycetota bacterium]|jgi:hypothetical protein